MRNRLPMILMLAVAATAPVQVAQAGRVFTPQLTTWSVTLNSGVAYITSSQMPSSCTPQRARINMSGAEYDKALFAYALSAKERGVSIRIVIDDTESDCVVYGIVS